MNNFNLQGNNSAKLDFVKIIDNYKILHFDELPILYVGTNKFGNKIIGSHLEDDDDTQKSINIHTILSNKEFYNFMHHKVSYLELLKTSASIFIIENDYNNIDIKAYEFEFESIPVDYLPTENSFCPTLIRKNSFNFSISLKGKLADISKAVAEDVSKIQNLFADFLEERIRSLKGFNLSPKALLHPYADGSFKINFELGYNQKSNKNSNFFIEAAPIDSYIAEYINYLFDNFSNDNSIFLDDNVDFSEKLKSLEIKLNEVYEKGAVAKPSDLKKILKDDILKSASKFEQITEQIGDNFDSISISNNSDKGDFPLAFIDAEFSSKFQSSIEKIEVSKSNKIIDEYFKDYNICIYHLNTDSRIGNAYIMNLEKTSEMSKPKIIINGDDGLDHTKYTESLYLNQWIDVKAKATRVGDKFKLLEISIQASK